MKMLPSLMIPLLLLASCSGIADSRRGIRDHQARDRNKRMVYGLALRIQRFLRWATPVKSTSSVREYVRVGNVRKALMDYAAIRPSNVKISTNKPTIYEKEGEIGEQLLILNNGGKTGKPTIEIRNRKEFAGNDDVTDRITYVDKIPK